uniref:Uncharacterized protein n=1 Tax=Mycena chlorophos TaxID=658473 RepID=A0ABQ0LZN4_MYCCL|nr:predicted protein [Mycena chlorophos]
MDHSTISAPSSHICQQAPSGGLAPRPATFYVMGVAKTLDSAPLTLARGLADSRGSWESETREPVDLSLRGDWRIDAEANDPKPKHAAQWKLNQHHELRVEMALDSGAALSGQHQTAPTIRDFGRTAYASGRNSDRGKDVVPLFWVSQPWGSRIGSRERGAIQASEPTFAARPRPQTRFYCLGLI